MKKILASIAFVAICCSGLFAQSIKVTGDAINMTSKRIVFGLPYCGLSINNGMDDSGPIDGGGTITPFSLSESGSTQGIVSIFHSGSIVPDQTNFMDLGSPTMKFRTLYYNSSVTRTNAQTLSDVRYKENIKNLENATEKIMALRSVTFDLKNTDNTIDTLSLKNKVGFIAQEMLEVLPHSVGYIPEVDMYTVDYTSVIPYLVQAFQTEHAEKEDLARQVAELREMVQNLVGQTPTTSSVAPQGKAPKANTAKLYQNVPNPTRENTTIRYELPGECSAKIVITAIDGKMVKTYRLPCQNGVGEIEISKHELGSGVYSYSLFVNDELVETRRMILPSSHTQKECSHEKEYCFIASCLFDLGNTHDLFGRE